MSQPLIDEAEIARQLCDIGWRIWTKGLCAGNEGNHSARVGENRFLCTPSGISKGFLKPEDICTVDRDGNQLAGRRKRSSEFLMHAAIYKARPDVTAIIHSHPPHATAFAVAGIDLPSCIHPEAEVFLGQVPTASYITPGDGRLAESILPFVHTANTVLMASHGVVCFDTDLELCYYKLEIVESYARVLILAKQLGQVQVLGSPEMDGLMKLKNRFGLTDPRRPDAGGKFPVAGDEFLSSVNDQASTTDAVRAAIRQTVPGKLSEVEIDALVKAIVKP